MLEDKKLLSRGWYAALAMCQAYQQHSPKQTASKTHSVKRTKPFTSYRFVYNNIVGTPTQHIFNV